MKPTIVAALMTAVLARPVPARACLCSTPAIEILPQKGVAAPINTHVWVLFPAYEEWRDGLGVKDEQVVIGLRAAAAAGAIEATRVDLTSAKLRVIELTPKQQLKAKTRYQVVLSVAGGKQEVIGELTTGEAADTVAPTFAGIKKGRMQEYRHASSCDSGVPFARLVLGEASDEGGPGKDALVYGLWTAGDDGRVAYDQPPQTYLVAESGVLAVGKAWLCSTPNYEFPKAAKQRKLILGVRAIDLAGNKADTAGEVVLDLSKVEVDPKGD